MGRLQVVKVHAPEPKGLTYGELERGELFTHESDMREVYMKVGNIGGKIKSISLRGGWLVSTPLFAHVYHVQGEVTLSLEDTA